MGAFGLKGVFSMVLNLISYSNISSIVLLVFYEKRAVLYVECNCSA